MASKSDISKSQSIFSWTFLDSGYPQWRCFLFGKVGLKGFKSGARRTTTIWKECSEKLGLNFGVQPIPRVAPESCSEIRVFTRSWLPFRELRREYSGIPRIAPRMAFFTPRAFFFKLGWFPGFWLRNFMRSPVGIAIKRINEVKADYFLKILSRGRVRAPQGKRGSYRKGALTWTTFSGVFLRALPQISGKNPWPRAVAYFQTKSCKIVSHNVV